MCSGIGGIDEGLIRAGWTCVWANDWDDWANRVYKKKFGNSELVDGDIKEIQADSIPDHTLLVAGLPCQAFSVAGKRKGFSDTRGALFFDFARIAEHKRPPLVLIENVEGLLSAQAVTEEKEKIPETYGYCFFRILETLGDLGYLLEWQVLNSKNFGVPQNRERVFVVGHLAGESARTVFPIGEADALAHGKESDRPAVQAKVSSAIHRRYGAGWRAHGQEQLIANQIGANYWKGVDRHGQRTVVMLHNVYGGFNEAQPRVFEETSPTIRTPKGGGHLPLVVADRTRTYANLGRNLESPKELTNALSGVQKDNLLVWIQSSQQEKGGVKTRTLEDVAPTLREAGGKGGGTLPMILSPINYEHKAGNGTSTRKRALTETVPSLQAKAGHTQGSYLLKDFRVRRLTPTECERLQGFPDGWTEVGVETNVTENRLARRRFISQLRKFYRNGLMSKQEMLEARNWVLDLPFPEVPVSDTERYKKLGNAVTVSVAQFLGERLKEVVQ